MADEEPFLVMVRVHKSQRNRFRPVRVDLASLRAENVDALDADLDLTVAGWLDLDVGFAEHDEGVAAGRGLQCVRHMQVGIRPGLEDGDATQPVKLGGMGRQN
jgi:hypothetical protein